MNAADLGGRNNHDIGPARGQECFDLLLTFEVEHTAIRSDDLAGNAGETPSDRRTDHAAMAGNVDAPAGELENPVGHRVRFRTPRTTDRPPKVRSDIAVYEPASASFSTTNIIRNAMKRPSVGSTARSMRSIRRAMPALMRLQRLKPPLSG